MSDFGKPSKVKSFKLWNNVRGESPEGINDDKWLVEFKDGSKGLFKLEKPYPAHEEEEYRATEATHEILVYQLSKVLGIDNVPKTIWFKYKSKKGSLQYFVEDLFLHGGIMPKYMLLRAGHILAFDYLIGNTDRHHHNYGYDLQGNLILFDHAYTCGDENYPPYSLVVKHGIDDTTGFNKMVVNIAKNKSKIGKLSREFDINIKMRKAMNNRIDQMKDGIVIYNGKDKSLKKV